MTAEVFEPVIEARNYEMFCASMRLWNGPTMPATERKRQESLGIIGPRRNLVVGKLNKNERKYTANRLT